MSSVVFVIFFGVFWKFSAKIHEKCSKNAQRHEKSITTTFSVQTHRNQKLSLTNCEPQNRKVLKTPFWWVENFFPLPHGEKRFFVDLTSDFRRVWTIKVAAIDLSRVCAFF